MNAKPISESSTPAWAKLLWLIFGLIFLLVGLLLFWMLFINPIRNHFAAQSWPTAKCQIISNTIEDHSDSESSSYRPVIKYRYTVDGENLEGERISFTQRNSFNKHSQAKSISRQFPLGSPAVCSYDPQKPSRSVLDPSFSHAIWFCLLPLLLSIVGLSLIRVYFRLAAAKDVVASPISSQTPTPPNRNFSSFAETTNQLSIDLSEADQLDQKFEPPQKLKPSGQKLLGLVFVAIFGGIWNTAVFFFASTALDDGLSIFSVLFALFMIPFLLVGVGMLIAFFYMLMALWNPKVEIACSTGAVPLGGEVDIAWEIPHRSGRIKKLSIKLEGQESATYVQGTDTRTETQLFAEIPITESTQPDAIAFGSTTIRIPEETMHTFESNNNRIVWQVVVHGDIPWWPDVNESFPFRVKP